MQSGARWVHRKCLFFFNVLQNTCKHYAIWSILCSSEDPDGDPGPPKARPCPPKGPICSRDWAWPSFGPSWPSFRTFFCPNTRVLTSNTRVLPTQMFSKFREPKCPRHMMWQLSPPIQKLAGVCLNMYMFICSYVVRMKNTLEHWHAHIKPCTLSKMMAKSCIICK